MKDGHSEFGERLSALRRHIEQLGLDGVIVPRFDEHQGEYCAPHDERLAFLTGFTGSAGLALVLRDGGLIFVDGRYQVQVRRQVDLGSYRIEHYDDSPVDQWLERHGAPGLRIGCNPMLVPARMFDRLREALARRGGELVALDVDPVDAIWPDQPERPLARIEPFPMSFSGETSASKRQRIAAAIAAAGADLLAETQPDNIAWLLNVRGGDVAFNPFPQSFLLLGADAGVEWFVDERKLPNDRSAYELDGAVLRPPEALLPRLGERAAGARVLLDPDLTSAAVGLEVTRGQGAVLHSASPITLAKAVKNPVELNGFRTAHLEDGVAWVEFLAWIDAHAGPRAAAGNPVTELEAEAWMIEARRRRPGFVYPSFRSISAASANAAMCHYAASEETDAPIGEGVYLLDSGGQYLSATTDATRTRAFGEVGPEVRRAYTAVLRGFVALMTLRFPVGTMGHQIDAFARRPLWDLGLDFDHGTGHGVGHFLSVHEQPHRIEKIANNHRMEAGLVMTVEPGYYEAGGFGMRVENQVEVVADGEGFLRFGSLTLVPIDLSLADRESLTEAEVAFLDGYHARVRQALADRVSEEARSYLIRATEPLGR
ncbi:Xaa-Pro aminopeptidase [Rubellimicrobium mesophilum DSM 19309]|uniref:Xaa-Pro aminopeptidase n=1 Tax=Rubellimicrobium mesophilum DSM 19309 TaxID=442562 RepID=A0A017HSY3_9RHOB|nr:M24 family metallopeptidase [Rubellimicrobium mesophilum]EYD77481.1 Xaa-Pro aminopeptidase [Rubellimicrobium mesophilum DSM 19309]